ncbi:conserved hypothetical protein [Ricinus communis]|uniref:Uncharacterized protein n=1 Tax=Ricinus communis TaxID=3988 RepID=B9RZF6_RICCO|nr:conserved hypothetical protein [Ricinus communis]
MSAAVVGTWVSELEKLKEKVRPKKPLLFLSKKAQGAVVREEKEAAQQESKVETTMSEATVCLLMDRFAPL